MSSRDGAQDEVFEEEEGEELTALPEERSGAVGAAEFLRQGAEIGEAAGEEAPDGPSPRRAPNLCGRGRRPSGPRLAKPVDAASASFTPEERLLLLDTWKRSGLSAGDFGALVGVSKHTLYGWRDRFQQHGPAGLMDRVPVEPKGNRVDEVTRRAILMLKESHPEYGCERISLLLLRGPGLGASASRVARVLKEEGYEFAEEPTRPHAAEPVRFERARANQLWQTDLFTFTLKRQNRRVYLVGFIDDHSRYVLGYGLYASPSSALVLEVLRAALDRWGAPTEILTDNGSQYVTWRGKSAFARELEKRGIQQVVARPKRPQTLGKIERFWGTLWRECVEGAVFYDLEDARKRIGLYIDHYNFQRPHQGIEGAVPADRFFGAAPEVLKTLKERVAANALELARGGLPKRPFYLTGQVGGRSFSVFAEGERVYLRRDEGPREELDLSAPDGAAGLPAEVVLEARAWKDTLLVDPVPEETLPAVVVPEGRPAAAGPTEAGQEQPLAPGVSPLDGALEPLQGGDV